MKIFARISGKLKFKIGVMIMVYLSGSWMEEQMGGPRKGDMSTELTCARRKSVEALRSLSIDERLSILGEMMDAIAEIKISMFMNATGCDRETAIRVLRERLMRLQEANR